MSVCPGCGVDLPDAGGATHAYIGASPECWALHGEVMVRAYEDLAWGRLRQLLVDAYAVQHPGRKGRRQAQSVALHLMTLQLFLEEGVDPIEGSRLHKRMVRHAPFEWLEPPANRGTLTIADVAATDDPEIVWDWARDAWQAWAPHHTAIRALIARTLP